MHCSRQEGTKELNNDDLQGQVKWTLGTEMAVLVHFSMWVEFHRFLCKVKRTRKCEKKQENGNNTTKDENKEILTARTRMELGEQKRKTRKKGGNVFHVGLSASNHGSVISFVAQRKNATICSQQERVFVS